MSITTTTATRRILRRNLLPQDPPATKITLEVTPAIPQEALLTDPTLTTDPNRFPRGKTIAVLRHGCELAELPLALVENTVLIAGLPFGGAVEVVYLYYMEEGGEGGVKQNGLVFY